MRGDGSACAGPKRDKGELKFALFFSDVSVNNVVNARTNLNHCVGSNI